MSKRKKGGVYPLAYLECRAVGPGGTTICFYPDHEKKMIKAIWNNESVPSGGYDDATYEAADVQIARSKILGHAYFLQSFHTLLLRRASTVSFAEGGSVPADSSKSMEERK